LVFGDVPAAGQTVDIRLLPLPATTPAVVEQEDIPRRTTPLVETRFSERRGRLSPDGRWLAYESNASGSFEIYVRPFPNVGNGQWQVSTEGGQMAVWGPGGRELLYFGPDGTLPTVPVDGRGAGWTTGSPVRLLEAKYLDPREGPMGWTYDVSPTGRLLMITQSADGETGTSQLVVVVNWTEELKRLVPAN
jgi:serine/threonine-protein kinase